MKFSSFNLKHLSQLLILCASLLFINNINAAEAAAKVLFAQGQVEATSNDDTRALNKGDDIFAADSIATGASSKVQMRFTDGGMLALRANTVFAVSSYVSPDEQQEGSLSFRLVTGGLRTVTGSIGKTNPENYEIKTSVATLGIRGTEFIAEVENDTLRVHVGEGEVFIYNGAGELSVQAGQNAIVRLDERPEYTNEAPQFNGASIDDQGGAEQHAAAEVDDASQSLESATQAATGIEQSLPTEVILHSETGEMEQDSNRLDITEPTVPGGTGPITDPELFTALYNGEIINNFDSFNDLGLTTPTNEVNTNGLTWGYALNPNPPTTLDEYDYFYIHGPKVSEMPISGVLSYSLVAGKAWINASSSIESIESFDMKVDLIDFNEPKFSIESLTAGSTLNITTDYTQGYISTNGSFEFNTQDIDVAHEIQVNGFFSGSNAQNAGVVFDVKEITGAGVAAGAAVLQR